MDTTRRLQEPAIACLALLACASCAPETDFQGSAAHAALSTTSDWPAGGGGTTTGCAWADWDGDGDLDLALVGSNDVVRVLENDGGVLTEAWSSADSFVASSVAWGDYDDDGDPDLAVGTDSGSPNVVFENDGRLGGTPAWASTEAVLTGGLVWADLDGDRQLELVAVNRNAQPLHVWRNTGSGLEATADPSFFAGAYAFYGASIAAGDIDGDGDVDLFEGTNTGQIAYGLINDGGVLTADLGSGPPVVLAAVFGDVDGDGDLDLFAGRGAWLANQVLENRYDLGGGLAFAFEDVVYDDTYGADLGDVDLDGDLDIAIANYGPTYAEVDRAMDSDGAFGFTESWVNPTVVRARATAFADVDGDGVLELLMTAFGPNALFESQNVGLHVGWEAPAAADQGLVHAVALGDWDGDGDLDLAVAQGAGLPTVVFQNNAGEFAPWWQSSELDDSTDLAWADSDGDGDLDLAVASAGGEPLRLYENHAIHPSSAGAFLTLRWSSPELDSTRRLAWADVDGDGDLDLALAQGAGEVGGAADAVYWNDGGDHTLGWQSSVVQPTGDVAWGDWDCDGDADLAAGDLDGGLSRIYRNDGGLLQTTPTWSGNLGAVHGLRWADVDGDGDLDLAVARGDDGLTALFENTGNCGTAALSSTPSWTAPSGSDEDLAFGDWDGDGDLDLALVDASGGPSRVFANAGGALEPAPRFSWGSGQATQALHWGDIDGDGDLDLATGSLDLAGSAAVLWNHRNGAALLPNDPTVVTLAPLTGTHRAGVGRTDPAVVVGGTAGVAFLLYDDEYDDAPSVRLEFSALEEGHWSTATVSGATTALAASPDGIEHTLYWDLVADGVQGDDVALRVVVEWQDPSSVAFPVQRGAIASAPVRARLYPTCFPLDADGDSSGCAEDCDDTDAVRFPGSPEVCDGVDNDCDGAVDEAFPDFDGDGLADCVDPDDDDDGSDDPDDCDDADDAVFPGAGESCDAVDSDCDGSLVDEFDDFDGDGSPDCVDPDDDDDGSPDADDCDDTDAARFPGNAEACDDLDSDCDGSLVDEFDDFDGDGVPDCVDPDDDGDGSDGDVDCDDLDPDRYPAALDQPDDGIDQDCNGADTITCFEDVDGDGYGASVTVLELLDADCSDDPGQSGVDSDCDDLSAAIHPGATEFCDGVDGDCSGVPSFDSAMEADADGDGVRTCEGDCDDEEAARFPGNAEVCDGLDNDCDPGTNELIDRDGDGQTLCGGDCDDDEAAVSTARAEVCDGLDNDCDPGTDENADRDADGRSICGGDCDEDNASVYEGAPELCDARDNDCDGALSVDELDGDGDGSPPCEGDCDDAEPADHPAAPERCDGLDNDCDGDVPVDERDGDADGTSPCEGDCDDAEPEDHPGADERCDGRDNDCDGGIPSDELDGDGDGSAPCDGDCDDGVADDHPGAPERCDGRDNDCDGDLPADERDDDGDGARACEGDCDDSDAALSPSAGEDSLAACIDGLDNDCDGALDREEPDCDAALDLDLAPGCDATCASGGAGGSSWSVLLLGLLGLRRRVRRVAPRTEQSAVVGTAALLACLLADPSVAQAAPNPAPVLVVASTSAEGEAAVRSLVGGGQNHVVATVPTAQTLGSSWLFGAEVLDSCPTATLAPEEVADHLARARDHIDMVELEVARGLLNGLVPRLGCLGAPADPEDLWKLGFLEAVALHFGPVAAPELVRAALARAIAARPGQAYDESFPPELRELYLEVQQEALGRGWTTAHAAGRVFIDGALVPDSGLQILPGTHLVQVVGPDELLRGGSIRVDDDAVLVGRAEDMAAVARGLSPESQRGLGRWLWERLTEGEGERAWIVAPGPDVVALGESAPTGVTTITGRAWAGQPSVQISVGAGYQRLDRWNYLATEARLSVRVVGPLRVAAWVLPAIGEVRTDPLDGRDHVPVLPSVAIGALLRFAGPVQPVVGAAFHLAPDANRSPDLPVLPGALGVVGVQLPLGRSPLSLEPLLEGGVLGSWPLLRGMLTATISI